MPFKANKKLFYKAKSWELLFIINGYNKYTKIYVCKYIHLNLKMQVAPQPRVEENINLSINKSKISSSDT